MQVKLVVSTCRTQSGGFAGFVDQDSLVSVANYMNVPQISTNLLAVPDGLCCGKYSQLYNFLFNHSFCFIAANLSADKKSVSSLPLNFLKRFCTTAWRDRAKHFFFLERGARGGSSPPVSHNSHGDFSYTH